MTYNYRVTVAKKFTRMSMGKPTECSRHLFTTEIQSPQEAIETAKEIKKNFPTKSYKVMLHKIPAQMKMYYMEDTTNEEIDEIFKSE